MSEFLSEQVLQKITKSRGKVTDLVVTNLCKEGENVTAILKEVSFRFQDFYTNSETSYNVILKFPNKDNIFYPLVVNVRGFEREAKIYSDFFPNVQMWQEKQFGRIKYELPLPKCFYGNTTEHFFIMENLKNCGFSIEETGLTGFDYSICKSVMEQLAVFHALSYAYINSFNNTDAFFKKYDYLKLMTREQFNEGGTTTISTKEYMGLLEGFVNALQLKYPSEEKLTKTIQNSIENIQFLEKTRNFTVENDVFNVLCHGDLWGNNILQNKVDGNDLFVKFVDLQVTKYCSPAADLVHFLWVSASEDVLSNHMNELILLYFTTFKNIVEDFKCRISFTSTDLLDFVQSLHFSGFVRFVLHAMFAIQREKNTLNVTPESNEEGVQTFFEKCIDSMKEADEKLLRHCLIRTKVAQTLNIFH